MCSGIRIVTKDGKVFVCRTMEFGQNILKFKKFVNNKIKGISTPDNKLLDGFNKFGLHVMCFYFPDYATYAASPDVSKLNVKPTDLAMLLLERCNTVDEVEFLAPNLNVVNEKYPPFPMTPPMHWMVTDVSGRSIVLEPENGSLNVYQNDLGIFANSPTFPEHLEEAEKALRNVSKYSDPKADSQGTGSVGLPGSFDSVARFVRLAFYADSIVQPKDATDGLNTCIHVLNNFDLVKGTVVSIDPQTKKPNYETTIYTSYYCLSDRSAFFKDYMNQQIRIL